jgi:hypothetical protein
MKCQLRTSSSTHFTIINYCFRICCGQFMHKHTRFCQRKIRPHLSFFFSRTNRSLTIVKERCFSGTHKKPSSCTKHLLLQLVLPQFQKPLLQASNMNTVTNCAYILSILNVTGRLCNYLSYQFQPLQGTSNFFYMNSTIQQTSIRCNDTFDFLT